MAISRVQIAASSNYVRFSSAINSLELTLPTPATAGNLLVGLWAVDKNSGTFTPPSGWIVLASQPGAQSSILAVAKIAAGGETAVTATWATLGEGSAGLMAEYAGVSTSDPIGPTHLPAYVDSNRTSMALDPAAAEAAGAAIALFTIDSIGDTAGTASRFAPTATGWTHVLTSTGADQGGTGFPGAALTERNTAVTSGENIPSTTFTWVNSDQVQGIMVLLNEGASTPPPATTPTVTSRAVGIPSATSAPLTVKTADATSVRIRATDTATQATVTSAAVTPDSQGLSDHVITGLTAGARYTYRVLMTDTNGTEHTDTASTVGKFRAAPVGQTSFAFCFGSCSYDGMGDINASANAIAARGDDLFLSIGDWYDQDGSGDSLTNFRAKFDGRMSTPGFAALFATVPFAYTPSDHDGMNNDSTAALHPTAWANWKTVYGERIPNPLPDDFMWGRVHFIVLDCRTRRGASGTTILGAEQKQWLKDTITASTAAAIVLVQDGIWIGSTNADTWHLYPAEQNELANHFAASGKNIVMLGGDMHAVAADDGTNSPGGIAVFQAAPLNGAASRKGGPYTHAPYPASGSTVVQQYGRIVVTDTDNSISLAYTGHSADGTARVTHTETYSLGSVTGTGTLTAPTPTLSGTGTLRTTGTGALTAPTASLAGSGQLRTIGSGSLAAAPSALSATGTVAISGSGGLTAPAASVQGSGTLTITGTGTLTAAGWSLAAAASVTISGTGTLVAAPAQLAGAGSITTPEPDTITGGGALTLAPPTLAGAGTLRLTGAGTLTAAAPTLRATGTVTTPPIPQAVDVTLEIGSTSIRATTISATTTRAPIAVAATTQDWHTGPSRKDR